MNQQRLRLTTSQDFFYTYVKGLTGQQKASDVEMEKRVASTDITWGWES